MFCKLAFRNVKRSVKDYFIYFLTLTFGVCLFYTFNSLGSQQVMEYLNQSQHYMVEAIMVYMKVLSAFVAVVLAGLILYANTFLLRRRNKELGTYLLLGMPLSGVSLILVLETLLIGLLALVSGLALGILAAHGLSILTMAMFRLTFEPLRFVFDPSAALFTTICFGVMFLVVMVFNQVGLSRRKLIDLMNAGRKNEELRQRPLGVSVALFLLGVLFLAIAYALLLVRGMLVIDFLFLGMLILGTLGTLLFFRGLSGFVLRLCQSNPKFYYKGLNMFVLRQWSGRIHSTYLSMTVICILLLLAIGATACSVGLNAAIEDNTDGAAPYDVTIQNYSGDTTVADLPALLTEHGFDCGVLFADEIDYLLYYNDHTVTGVSEQDAYAALRWSDYNALMALQGKSAMEPIQAGVLTDSAIYTDFSSRYGYAVIPDELVEQLEVRRQVLVGNYAGDKEQAETLFQSAVPNRKPESERRYVLTDLHRKYGFQDPGSLHRLVSGRGIPPGLGGGAGSAAALPGGGQRHPLPHADPPGCGGAAAKPLRLRPGGAGLRSAPGTGDHPRGGGHEGRQRRDFGGRPGGRRVFLGGHGSVPGPDLRGLFPGYLPGQ